MGPSPEINKIEIDNKSLKNLNTIRKWAMFIAVTGFIFLGLMIAIGILAGTFLSAFNADRTGTGIPEIPMAIIFMVLAIAGFFPLFFLFRFSKETHHAVNTINAQELNKAIKSLKYFFLCLGLLIIIVLAVYIIALVVAGSTMAFFKGI